MSRRIELCGVVKLKDCLIRSEYLIPDISECNNIPSWDGLVEVYNNKDLNKKKSTLLARVPVQVKGQMNSDILCDIINFNVDKADLINYLKDGGVIFFVVCLRDFDNYRIYYEALTPLKLKRYIKNMEKRNSISLTLKTFPKDNIDEFTDIFFNFSLDMNKQPSEKYLSLNDLNKNPPVGFDTISVRYLGIQYKDPMDYFLTHDVVLYANHSGAGISFPVEHIKFTEFGQIIDFPVVIDNTEYYSNYRLSYSKEGTKVIIGNSVSFLHLKDSGKVIFNLKFAGTLSQRINDTEFVLALLKHKYYSVTGDNPHTFSFGDDTLEGINFDKSILYYTNCLKLLNETKQVLEILRITDELNIDAKTDKDDEYINILISSILYKESQDLIVSSKTVSDSFHTKIKICNLSISLLITKEEDGKYKIENFYDNIYSGFYDVPGTDRTINVPLYLALSEDDFITVSNIDYEAMVKSFIDIEVSIDLIEMTYFFILTMLNAYDKSKKQILLDTSLKLLEWIINSGQNTIYEIYLLNKLQIFKRNRELSAFEISQLNNIVSSNKDNKILTGAYILLENFDMADYHFNKMSQNEQTDFKNFPINIFWKK